jgi:hypothetical protein
VEDCNKDRTRTLSSDSGDTTSVAAAIDHLTLT